MSENVAKLEKLLGGKELLKSGGVGSDALKKAIEKIKKEQTEANEKKAEELIRKALEIYKKKEDLDKQFKSNMNKIEKELGKAVKAIENIGNSESSSEVDKNTEA